MSYGTRKNTNKDFKVLSFVIFTIINNYVCIDYLSCESKKLSEIPVCSGGVLKHGNKSFDKILVIGIPDLVMKLLSCYAFLKKIHSFVIIKFPKKILEYYFSKGFTLLECNTNNLEKIQNEVKDRIHAENTENFDKVVTCTTTITTT